MKNISYIQFKYNINRLIKKKLIIHLYTYINYFSPKILTIDIQYFCAILKTSYFYFNI